MDCGILAYTADVTKDDSIGALLESVENVTHGRLDVLVNNA